MGTVLVYLGAALCAAAIPARGDAAKDLLLGSGDLASGVGLAVQGAPWAAAIPLVLGVLLLWFWWNRRGGKKRVKKALGDKAGRYGMRSCG